MNTVTPALGLSATEVESVLEAASRAPSVHNSQPWRFRILDHQIELHADLDRRLPATDPENRELRLSCGAALLNLRLALQGHGIRPLVTLLPSGHQVGGDWAGPLAVVRYGGHAHPSRELTQLLHAVRTRRTNRRPFIDAPVPTAHRTQLVRAAESERGWLHILSDSQHQATLRELIARAHHEQMANPDFTAELATWTGREDNHHDGVPLSAGGPQPEPQDEWVLRDFTAGRGHTRVPGKDFEPHPLLVILCAFHEGPLAELQAGQALQHTLLTTTTLGLSASFLSQPIEVPHIRAELRRALKITLNPQAILRLGFGSPVPATPRRPVTDLLMPSPTPTTTQRHSEHPPQRRS
ncbi:MAG: nitroreductase family protein [Pseudonocardiales bacterium]|nr:nitroreductase family protein [Pseudonocardiales bacterium]